MSISASAGKLRVAIVSDWYLPRFGGIEMQLDGLTQALAGAGVDVEVFTPVPGPDRVHGILVNRLNPGIGTSGGYWFPPSPVASNLRDFAHVFELMSRRGPSGPLGRLTSALAGGGFDLVHAQLGNTPFAYLAVNTCLALDMPVVATFHSMLSPGEIPVAALGCRLLGCGKWPGRARVTAVSTQVARVRQPMIGGEPIDILPNGIDAGWWSRAGARHRPAKKQGPIELVAAMRLHARKRPMALLSALNALSERGLLSNGCRLRIAGDGPLRDKLMARVRALGLNQRVQFVGRLERPALAEFLAGADLFLMPSFFESFGIAALEARMAGTPVLTMENSGAWDFLTPGVDSLSAHDDQSFVESLGAFVADPDLRRRLKTGCAAPIEGYDWADLSAHVIDLYRATIGNR